MPGPIDHEALLERLTQTVRDLGADPHRLRGKVLRELMHTTTKLADDDVNVGELKLLSRSLKELRYALKVFRPYEDIRKISVFGSARTPIDHPDYLAAAAFSRDMADHGWMTITGAGDGIMRAGNDGATREKSFGVSINLPFETNTNDIISGDNKLIHFRYFFTRKLMFMWMSHAVSLFPGGFGTQDEGFEALTLIQTGKAPVVPIVMVDAPGGDYWHHWDNYVRRSLLDKGWISEDDLNLYKLFDDPAQAGKHVRAFYRNYHSSRFVRDTQVLRMHRPITDEQLDRLNTEFAKLVKGGVITQTGPLKEERGEWPGLTRLQFHSTKRDYGTLRKLIDRLNEYDAINHPG